MPTWTITIYNPDNDNYLEFDMDSNTKPTDLDVMNYIEIFVGAEDNLNN